MTTGKPKIFSKTHNLQHLSHSRYDSTELFRLKHARTIYCLMVTRNFRGLFLMIRKNQSKLINAFLNPELYEHPVSDIELVETHISWVFLTGQFAYKLKKPVNFGFLNFSTLALRKYYCEQELKLNKRLAPHIYLDVIPVTESEQKLSLSAQGKIIDYVVKMKQFDHSCLLSKLIKNEQLKLSDIDSLSKEIADFHDKICIADPHSDFGSTQQVMQPVEENFSILKDILSNTQFSDQLNKDDFHKNIQQILNTLHKQVLLIYQDIVPLLKTRRKAGFIRECHGDLHLGNIALIEHEILLFDGIEFNDNLRWIDTISDCAFLIMDLQDQQKFIFAHHFLNQYLSKTGDYSSLSVIKFYQLYRAMVRAKVAVLRLQQQKEGTMSYKNTLFEIRNYLELAQSYVPDETQKSQTFLAISFGISGSGKSWLSTQLADNLGAIQLRSDIERKRLFLQEEDDLYSNSTTQKTYNHLMKICEIALNAAYPVIVDATFLDKKWRRKFCEIAQKKKIPFHILSCYANQKTIIQRLKIRQHEINNISDADIAVMQKQLKNNHQLEPEEKKYEISINTTTLSDCSSIIDQIQKRQPHHP